MCNCITEMNARLKQHPEGANTMLMFNLIGSPKAFVATCKLSEKVRKKPTLVIASYCPFCGEKYERATPSDAHGTMPSDEQVSQPNPAPPPDHGNIICKGI